ncbi:MAG: hypothetical protein IBJ00_00150, partial [Alphaproteobacteria bacterium]|nr:hypothetical protein [Alphaproteobacteria bacterium]
MLKRILFKNKKVSYYSLGFYLIIFCSSILLFPLRATEEYKTEDSINANKRIDIISPEAVEIVKKLNFLSARYPEISKHPPHIDSKESFQLAKHHLLLTQSLGTVYFTVFLQSCKNELLGEFHHLCNNVISYIEVLRAPCCSTYRSEEDEKELENEFYKTTYYIGRNYLMSFLSLRSTENLHLFPQYVSQIKLIKATLRNNTQYYRLLQETIANAQALTPQLTAYLDSSDNLGDIKASSSKRISKKVQHLKDLSFHQKLAEFTEPVLQGPYKECFDLYFHATVNKIFTEASLRILKSRPYDEYVADLQKLANNYLTLEHEGAKFRNTLQQ